MELIENRIDVIKNIYQFYTYTKGIKENRDWALKQLETNEWFVAERFGNTLLFAPAHFVCTKDNAKDKLSLNETNFSEALKKFIELNIYRETDDYYITSLFEKFMSNIGAEIHPAKFLFPNELDIHSLDKSMKCYFISPTHCKGQKANAWKSFQKKNIAAIGWKHNDYTNYSDDEINREYQNDSRAKQAFSLIKQINSGDIICCTNNNFGLWGIGIALSGYKYTNHIHYAGIDDEEDDAYYSHYVDVAWLRHNNGSYIYVSDLNIPNNEKQWQPYGTLSVRKRIPQYISDYILRINRQVMKNNNYYQKYIELLEANKNLILTGAPGTGKTFLAKAIAKAMNAEYDFVQFHPSYDYTDFVEGLRPTPPDRNGNIGFERKDGIFKEFCKKAIKSAITKPTTRNTSFDILYDGIVSDIKQGKITKYQNRKGDDRDIGLTDKDRILFTGKTLKEDNIRLMFEYLLDKGIYDLTSYTRDDYFKIISEVSNDHTKTIDYVQCGWILQELLKRHREFAYSDDCLVMIEDTSTTPTDTLSNRKKYVLIIDEINRGEISKIFGELFFSIDPGYRGESTKVKTQYQNLITNTSDEFYNGFYVPENVYIIGTMNDIDRSVESMDFAMRRRFAWAQVKANNNVGMLDELHEMKNDAIDTMNRLNAAIWDEKNSSGIEGLNSDYHIGGAYFRNLKNYLNKDFSNKKDAFKSLWENHLKGILFEYLRGTINVTENLKILEQAYFNKNITNEIER